MSECHHDQLGTVFGSRLLDRIAFWVLLFLLIVLSGRLEVYSRASGDADTPPTKHTERNRRSW